MGHTTRALVPPHNVYNTQLALVGAAAARDSGGGGGKRGTGRQAEEDVGEAAGA